MATVDGQKIKPIPLMQKREALCLSFVGTLGLEPKTSSM